MPVVFSNTSPLQYLHQIGQLEVLPALFGEVQVADAVVAELVEGVRRRVSLPNVEQLAWVRRRRVADATCLGTGLGKGEAETIALGRLDPGALVILDDGPARRAAKAAGLEVVGTVGVLLRAKESGYIDAVGPNLVQLLRVGFRLGREIHRLALIRAGESEGSLLQ